MDSTDIYYDNRSNVHVAADCAYRGCMDSSNCNYNPTAVMSDPSACETRSGCTDSTADNYDSANKCELAPSTCTFASLEVKGCMTPAAYNYDSLATQVGQCVASKKRCCHLDAVNYNCPPSVPGKWVTVSDDAKCKFVGCTDSTKVDYNPSATAGDVHRCEKHYPPAGGSDARRSMPASISSSPLTTTAHATSLAAQTRSQSTTTLARPSRTAAATSPNSAMGPCGP